MVCDRAKSFAQSLEADRRGGALGQIWNGHAERGCGAGEFGMISQRFGACHLRGPPGLGPLGRRIGPIGDFSIIETRLTRRAYRPKRRTSGASLGTTPAAPLDG